MEIGEWSRSLIEPQRAQVFAFTDRVHDLVSARAYAGAIYVLRHSRGYTLAIQALSLPHGCEASWTPGPVKP